GTRVDALSSYRVSAVTTIPAGQRIALREPVKKVSGLADAFLLQTAWVRDDHVDAYSESAFLADVETVTYAGILADPVYRWRDGQLAFYQFADTGFTTSYYSGLDTRCGQNPWPSDASFPAALRAL